MHLHPKTEHWLRGKEEEQILHTESYNRYWIHSSSDPSALKPSGQSIFLIASTLNNTDNIEWSFQSTLPQESKFPCSYNVKH
jgi:hypothetical protein